MESFRSKHLNRTRVLLTLLIFQLICNILFVEHYFGHVNLNNLFYVSSRVVYNDINGDNTSLRRIGGWQTVDGGCGYQAGTIKAEVRNETVRDGQQFIHGSLPLELPTPVLAHQILWSDSMTFRNYLSILSVWKTLKPYQIKLYIQKNFKFQEFVYDDWYQKAISRISTLQIVKLDLLDKTEYSKEDEIAVVETVLKETGGIYVNINTILNSDLQSQLNSTFHADLADDLSISFLTLAPGKAIPETFKTNRVPESGTKCVPFKLFTESELCCSVTENIFPYSIMRDNSTFGYLARTLFYGSPSIPEPSTSFPPIPKIVHYVWFGRGNLDYSMYLSFLSTQRFIKPLQIRIYVDTNNTSMYLKKMAEFKNVQIVFYGHLKSIFQTPVRAVSHASDFLRADVLYRFGGMYIDWDVYWLKPIDDLVSKGYETISSLDYYDDMFPRKTYPDTINMGVLLAVPGSRFISLWRDSFKQYSGRHHTWHAVENVYKLYEEHPSLLVIDKRLQIMCHELRCHPLWLDDYKTVKAHHEFDFTKDVYAVHFTAPTPEAFTSEKHVKESKGFFADMARHVLGDL